LPKSPRSPAIAKEAPSVTKASVFIKATPDKMAGKAADTVATAGDRTDHGHSEETHDFPTVTALGPAFVAKRPYFGEVG